MRSQWFRHGFLNTLEHGVTRFADALTSIVLLWSLSSESFSKLALAQAYVAPVLFLFVSPEVVIYRDFHKWKEEGRQNLTARLRIFRLFSWGKAQAALFIALLLALTHPQQFSYIESFFAFIWAFSLVLAPQIAGPDREFLRLHLKLKDLNAISLYQKLALLGGTALVALLYPNSNTIIPFAIIAAFSALSAALIASWRAKVALAQIPVGGQGTDLSVFSVLYDSLHGFSVWSHVQGILTNWVQSMDLFFLGLWGLPVRQIGLYAAALKLANFSSALPTALANLFSIWLGRRPTDDGEKRTILKYSGKLFASNVIQAIIIAAIAPFAIQMLSHGRWTEAEQREMFFWLLWILSGMVLITSTYLLSSWLALRGLIKGLLGRVVVPWAIASFVIYAVATRLGGFEWAARANVIVAAVYVILIGHLARYKCAIGSTVTPPSSNVSSPR